ncbi:hypothetical protein K438DRAFT_1755705 [Mycena galopus ATCC 62051]|nr:hypothetical protein K438DRAFT_1755705 [Mycena galopus ATCC 62051]
MAFFNGCEDFQVTGGAFYNIQGNMYTKDSSVSYTTNESYNGGGGDYRAPPSPQFWPQNSQSQRPPLHDYRHWPAPDSYAYTQPLGWRSDPTPTRTVPLGHALEPSNSRGRPRSNAFSFSPKEARVVLSQIRRMGDFSSSLDEVDAPSSWLPPPPSKIQFYGENDYLGSDSQGAGTPLSDPARPTQHVSSHMEVPWLSPSAQRSGAPSRSHFGLDSTRQSQENRFRAELRPELVPKRKQAAAKTRAVAGPGAVNGGRSSLFELHGERTTRPILPPQPR